MQLAPLVERELELETVERLLAGARAGSGGAVVLEGPAGIGKSSLLAAARAAAAPDLRVLSARGGELERELPFGIVRQLLEPVVATDPAEREVLLAGAAALAEPVLSETDPETGSEASFSALHGLYWLTVNLAGSQPVLVTVDDAHWADVASLRWLIYLARRLEDCDLGDHEQLVVQLLHGSGIRRPGREHERERYARQPPGEIDQPPQGCVVGPVRVVDGDQHRL